MLFFIIWAIGSYLYKKANKSLFMVSMWAMGIVFFFFFFTFFSSQGLICINSFIMKDSMSSLLVMLSIWIISMSVLAGLNMMVSSGVNSLRVFMVLIMTMMLSLMVVFFSVSLTFFYIFFEFVLIPMSYMILGWGYQPERFQAVMYMLLYTVGASLPLMVVLLCCYKEEFTMSFLVGSSYDLWWFGGFSSIILILVFLVKLPVFIFHLWLPKAHVEAPVFGSMILAGILLKLGGFGILRVSMFFLVNLESLMELVLVLGIWGSCVTGVMCFRQSDVKSMIAYSSIGHMGLVLGGCLSSSLWGLEFALLMMVSHGLCSSGLFALANFYYESLGSRSMIFLKGGLVSMPYISLSLFMLLTVNMSSPPSMSWISEVLLISTMVYFSGMMMIVLFFIPFIVCVFCLYLFISSQHGQFSEYLNFSSSSGYLCFLVAILHWLPAYLMVPLILMMGVYF
uniref:NADH-ubiquinone oxidoreductase chain 4 n=1 Tax=Cuspidaria undata TaxID=2952366 RepID=A0AAT9T4S2_9BIVA|nr:NADH dehydrogenase subunit 4 [Cuspidaria undata]USF19206.1 NADH dehydrogenase subunit 4 [Cuspidaria undata]